MDYGTQRPDGGGSKWVSIGTGFRYGYWYAPLSPSAYAEGHSLVNHPATITTWTGAALLDEGYWVHTSDVNRKTAFTSVDRQDVLDRLVAMPVQMWRYKTEPETTRHIGPTAQDFMKAFRVGVSDTTISDVDSAGVALAAIQGLYQKLMDELRQRDAQIAELRARLVAVEASHAQSAVRGERTRLGYNAR